MTAQPATDTAAPTVPNEHAPLRPGDVIVTRSAGTVGALIRFGERVRYHGWWPAVRHTIAHLLGVGHDTDPGPAWCNHAAVYVGDGQIIEALAAGLTLSPIAKYSPADYRICRLDTADRAVGPFERQAAVGYAQTMLARHCSYGWLSIASIVAQLLTPTKLDVSYDGAMICSAFAAACWEHAGIVLPTRSALTTMPADFWRWVE